MLYVQVLNPQAGFLCGLWRGLRMFSLVSPVDSRCRAVLPPGQPASAPCTSVSSPCSVSAQGLSGLSAPTPHSLSVWPCCKSADFPSSPTLQSYLDSCGSSFFIFVGSVTLSLVLSTLMFSVLSPWIAHVVASGDCSLFTCPFVFLHENLCWTVGAPIQSGFYICSCREPQE